MIWTIVLLVLAGLGIMLTPISILLVRELFLKSIERDGLRMKLLQASTKALPQETPSDMSLSRPYRTLGENGAPPALPPAGPRKFRNGELVCALTRWQYLRFLRHRSWDADRDGVIVRVGDELLRNADIPIFRSDSRYDSTVGPGGVVVHQNETFFCLDGRVVCRGRCLNWSPHKDGVLRVIGRGYDRQFWLNDRQLQYVDNRSNILWSGGVNLTVLCDDGINLVHDEGWSKLIYPHKDGKVADITSWFGNYPDRLVVQSGKLVILHKIGTGKELVLYNGPLDDVHDHPEGVVVRRGRRFYFYDGGSREDARKP